MRAPALVLALLAATLATAPTAQAQAAGSVVDVTGVVVPTQTVGGHPFPVSLTLTNKGSAAIDVQLMGALYLPREPDAAPCGRADAGRFLAFTHMVQPQVRLAPGETREYPAAGATPWMHRYDASFVRGDGGAYELCVFALEPSDQQRVEYLDFEPVPLQVRATNAPPTVDFTFEPSDPLATREVRFAASAADPDGDALTYTWDFGHFGVSGRAVAEGAEARHAFYPQGVYTVTLTVSDGFSSSSVSREVAVGPEPPAPATLTPTSGGPDGDADTPAPLWISLAAVALALASRRAPRRRG